MGGRHRGRGTDIGRLRYFVAACDYGGFSKAAIGLGVAQPAITRHVRLLEEDLGVSLFTRNGRDAVPTEAGVYLLREARPHLDRLDSLVDTMRREFNRPSGDVRLGVCPSIAPLFLDQNKARILDALEVHRLRVVEAYSGELRSLMATGNIDLALTYSQTADDSLDVKDLVSERLAVAARKMPSERALRFQDLTKLTLILPSKRHQLRRIIDAVAKVRRIELVPAVELDSIPAVMTMLDDEERDFATILPFHSVAEAAADGRIAIRQIDDPAMVRTIALALPKPGGGPVPRRLVESIVARAEVIKSTMEAVF